ncbi:substrate-binding domain-containing protein [Massilia sp. 2TAF26]|uniref:substrate-binding domain-containing protein n=1 Tax=Massilia sp. 2TAF26 TaxID=3233012 RepID=UPI003F9E82A8
MSSSGTGKGRGAGRGSGRATLEQVAVRAGVSTMDASRAIGQPELVPSLTTVETPRYQVGYRAASLLLDVIAGKTPPARRIDLGFTLRERESA